MTKEEYQKKLADFIEASIAYKKSGRAGRVLGIMKAKLLPALDKVQEYVANQGKQVARKTKFKVVTKGDAKPKPQPKEEEQAEPVERKILADSESKPKRTRKRKAKAKQQPKKD